MDPEANIKEQKELAEAILRDYDDVISSVDASDAARLAELVIARIEFLANQG